MKVFIMRNMMCSSPRWLVLALLVCSATFASGPADAAEAFSAPRAARLRQILDRQQAQPSGATFVPAAYGQTSPQDFGGPLTSVSASFEGIPTDFTLEPPDPSGAAGPSRGLQHVDRS